MKARFRAALIAVTLTSVFSLPQRVGAETFSSPIPTSTTVSAPG